MLDLEPPIDLFREYSPMWQLLKDLLLIAQVNAAIEVKLLKRFGAIAQLALDFI